MSAQTGRPWRLHGHPEFIDSTRHPEWCHGNHVYGSEHRSEQVTDGETWAVELAMTDDGRTWVSISTDDTLTRETATAMAAALIAAADRIDGVPFDHGVLWCGGGPPIRVSTVLGDTSDAVVVPGEQARAIGVQLLAQAGSGWSENYNGDPGAELYVWDLPGEPFTYGRCAQDGLRRSTITRLERKVATIAAALPRVTMWPTVMWGTDHGDAVVEALGTAPPLGVLKEFSTPGPGWGGCSVPRAVVGYLTAQQLRDLREQATRLFRATPRAAPPAWARGLPNADGALCGKTTYIRNGRRLAPKSVGVTPIWDPVDRPQIAVGVPADHSPEDDRHWLQLSLPQARALAAEITRQADMIESGATR